MRILLLALMITVGAVGCGGSKKSSKTPAAESKDDAEAGERDASQPDDSDDMPSQSSDDPMGDGGGE